MEVNKRKRGNREEDIVDDATCERKSRGNEREEKRGNKREERKRGEIKEGKKEGGMKGRYDKG